MNLDLHTNFIILQYINLWICFKSFWSYDLSTSFIKIMGRIQFQLLIKRKS